MCGNSLKFLFDRTQKHMSPRSAPTAMVARQKPAAANSQTDSAAPTVQEAAEAEHLALKRIKVNY